MANKNVRKVSANKKVSRKKSKPQFNRDIASKCGQLLGERVTAMEYPGGRSRRSFRIVLKNTGSAIVSIRPKLERANTERAVLKELSQKDTQVPKLLASDGKKMLIQEEISGERLSQAMHDQNETRVESVLDSALTSLADSHQAGSDVGFDSDLAPLGDNADWIVQLLNRPAVIGNVLDLPAPRPKLKQLESLLAVRKPRFIKWDSRPGNAMVREDGKVYWFDWEHCGTRNRLDDMAWLLADEYVPDYPAAEARLIEKHIANFADDLSIDEAMQYLSAYGVFHLAVRLGLICKYKVGGQWWDHEYCLARDKVGVSQQSMYRVCKRGERWAKRNPYTEALAPWFVDIAHHFQAQSLYGSV
jgi:Phosphotransferase enzyme family